MIANIVCLAGTAGADPAPKLPNPSTGKSGPSDFAAKVPPSDQPSAQASLFVNVNCKIKVDNPHHSHHFPDTINVEATTTCSPPGAFSITQIVTLWYVSPPAPNVPIGTGVPGVGTGFTLTSQAATACVNGTYYGTADAALTFPPVSIPPFGAIGNVGPTVTINDC